MAVVEHSRCRGFKNHIDLCITFLAGHKWRYFWDLGGEMGQSNRLSIKT